MDILGHLNNVAYAAQFENGRVRFNRAMDERRNRAEVTAGWSQQLRSITSAKDISPMMLRLHAGLAGDRAGTAAMTVTKNWRLTFRVSEHHALIDLDLEDYR